MKLLFASTYCLLDTTSGAAIAARSLLEQLSVRGVRCEAVGATIFDSIREVALESFVPQGSEGPDSQGAVIELLVGGVRHTLFPTSSSRHARLAARESDGLLALAGDKMREFQPDVVLTYGGYPVEKEIHHLSRRHGSRVVFFLANGKYTNRETFQHADLIVVSSEFLATLYQERLGLRSHVLYPVLPAERCKAPRVEGRFVTYINSGPRKGLTLFLRLAKEAAQVLPSAEFLVVEGRWGQETLVQAGLRIEEFPNVTFIGNQRDMRDVYAKTRVFLFPSFGDEGFGQSIVEAQLNGIPVVASRRGGIPEALNGGGFLLDVPERCVRDNRLTPSAEEVGPWIEQIRALIENEEIYQEARQRAYQASKKFAPELAVQAAMELFTELLKTGKD